MIKSFSNQSPTLTINNYKRILNKTKEKEKKKTIFTQNLTKYT